MALARRVEEPSTASLADKDERLWRDTFIF
jgi:hypothetical protein